MCREKDNSRTTPAGRHALRAEDRFGATALTPSTAPTIRSLADLEISTLALMHAPAFTGKSSAELRQLADAYEQRLLAV